PAPETAQPPRTRPRWTRAADTTHSRWGPPRNTPAADSAPPTGSPDDGSPLHHAQPSPIVARFPTTRRVRPPRARLGRHRALPTSRPNGASWLRTRPAPLVHVAPSIGHGG